MPETEQPHILEIDANPEELGLRMAEGLLDLVGPWPKDMDPRIARLEDRINSPQSLLSVWSDAKEIVFGFDDLLKQEIFGLDPEVEANLRAEIDKAREDLLPLIRVPAKPGISYFAPFNAAPGNCEVSEVNKRGRVTYSDLNNVGAAPNRNLAILATFSNMAGRLCFKDKARQALLTGLVIDTKTDMELDDRLKLAIGAIALKAIYFTKYVTRIDHPEMPMAKAQIATLPSDLWVVRIAYQSHAG